MQKRTFRAPGLNYPSAGEIKPMGGSRLIYDIPSIGPLPQRRTAIELLPTESEGVRTVRCVWQNSYYSGQRGRI